MFITDDIRYVGVNDHDIDLFEGQYVVENGMAYNSYVIMDEQIAVMDTVDGNFTDEWLKNISDVIGDRKPSYLIVQHMEPDHSANIANFLDLYKDAKVVATAKAFVMMKQFFGTDYPERQIVVKEGDTLSLGTHTLTFVLAPMVHWPEVMVEYEVSEKVLFSADGFGKFGALSADEDWACEARRYYFNIVGKYGMPVQTLLKKAAALEINTICPLHGPILKENLSYYIGKYATWSSYEPEDKGVLIACASIHGNTLKAGEKMAEILKEKGVEKVSVMDLSRDDMAEAIEDAFRYDRMILAAATYDGGVFPVMEDFLNRLAHKSYQKRTVGLIENGSWAPLAGKVMKGLLEPMKDVKVCENMVTVKSVMKEENIEQMEKLAEEIINC